MKSFRKLTVVLTAVCAAALPFSAKSGDKVQKITFVEDDGQKSMASKVYTLKYAKAADIAPFIRSAVFRYTTDSHVSSLSNPESKREMIVVSTGVNFMPYLDKLIAAFDRKAKVSNTAVDITGDGIAYGIYQPKYRAAQSMLDAVMLWEVSSGSADGTIRFDSKRNLFYFKDAPATLEDLKNKFTWLDKPIPQVRLEMKVYQVRDSDLKDIGIDYLAWKNGPGLNLFSAAYNAFGVRAAELLGEGIDVAGNISRGFGGFYVAPSFDLSFLRILQQSGKATISSTASIMITNNREMEFKTAFAPEYQNLTKDKTHASAVTVGGNSSLTATIHHPVITAGKEGCVNFNCNIVSNNVVERNNLGVELVESENISTHTMIHYNKEELLASWNRTSEVEQNIGVPFLCELPVLKYIFGTTTTSTEVNRFFVTVRAVPVVINENMTPGTVAEFDKLAGKSSK